MDFVSKLNPSFNCYDSDKRVSYKVNGRNIISLLDTDEIVLNLAPVGSIPNTGKWHHKGRPDLTSYKLTTNFDSDKQSQKMVADYLKQAQQGGWEMIKQEYPVLEREIQDIEEEQKEFDQRKQEILEDNEDLKNEKKNVISQVTKRYQKVVRVLKLR